LSPPGTTGRKSSPSSASAIAALEASPGAIPAAPVADTLKRVNGGLIQETVPRDGLFRAQTPQASHQRIERRKHERLSVQKRKARAWEFSKNRRKQ